MTFSSKGAIVGSPPVLSLPVPASAAPAAQEGALHVAFRSSAPGGWTAYPATYDAATGTLNAPLKHFSTWRFWTDNWASDLASINQAAGQWEGRRAAAAPSCAGAPATPSWYASSSGIQEGSDLPVLGCVAGYSSGNILDVQLVNNRPYGMMLNLGGADVQWDNHAGPDTLVATLRNAIGDYAARAHRELYLPPLSRASVGIINSGKGRTLTLSMAPTRATILADSVETSLGPLVKSGVSAVAEDWGNDVFKDAVSSCAQFLSEFPVTSIPDQATAITLVTSSAPECLERILLLAAGAEADADAELGAATGGVIGTAVVGLRAIIEAGKWAEVEDKVGKILDFTLDNTGLGYAASLVTRATHLE